MDRRLSHFPGCAEGPSCETEAFPKATKTMKKVFNHNTHLGVNVKTVLNNDRIMRVGKDYQGVLKRDVEIDEFRYDEHFELQAAEDGRRFQPGALRPRSV